MSKKEKWAFCTIVADAADPVPMFAKETSLVVVGDGALLATASLGHPLLCPACENRRGEKDMGGAHAASDQERSTG